MDYGTFTPEAGYNARAAPAAKSARLAAAEAAGLAKREGAFDELMVTEGVGAYHINHFISYGSFMATQSAEVTKRANEFLRDFVDIFEPNTAAGVKRSKHRFQANATVEFFLGGDDFELLDFVGGLVHSDWVSMQKAPDGESFYGSTLRRRWITTGDLVLKVAEPEWLDLVRVNQHHFLAGRRSWRLGYDAVLKRPYVETAAFERSSLCEYYAAEKTGAFRKTIIQIWTSLLENARKEFTTINWIPPGSVPDQKVRTGYETLGNVDYRMDSFETAKEALDTPWFTKILPRHPGLLKGL